MEWHGGVKPLLLICDMQTNLNLGISEPRKKDSYGRTTVLGVFYYSGNMYDLRKRIGNKLGSRAIVG